MAILTSTTQAVVRSRAAGPFATIALVAVAASCTDGKSAAPKSHEPPPTTSSAAATTEPVQIVVRVPAPGFGPAEIEQLVLLPVEEALRDVPKLVRMASMARADEAILRLEFAPNDVDAATGTIRNALEQLQRLPEAVERPTVHLPVGPSELWVRPRDPERAGVATAGAVDPAAAEMLDELRSTKDVRGLEACTQRRRTEIRLDPDHITAYALNVSTVIAAIRSATVDVAGGSLGHGGGEFMIRTPTANLDAESLGQIVVRHPIVRLGDVATISDSVDPTTSCRCEIDGHPATCATVLIDEAARSRTRDETRAFFVRPRAGTIRVKFPSGRGGEFAAALEPSPTQVLRWYDDHVAIDVLGSSARLLSVVRELRRTRPLPVEVVALQGARPHRFVVETDSERDAGPALSEVTSMLDDGGFEAWSLDGDTTTPQIQITINEDRRPSGLGPTDIATALASSTTGVRLGEEIVLWVGKDGHGSKPDVDALRHFPLFTNEGRVVPLQFIADVSVDRGPVELVRLNGERGTLVTVWVLPERAGDWAALSERIFRNPRVR